LHYDSPPLFSDSEGGKERKKGKGKVIVTVNRETHVKRGRERGKRRKEGGKKEGKKEKKREEKKKKSRKNIYIYTHNRRIKLINLPPFLLAVIHDINLIIFKRPFLPNSTQHFFRISAQGAI
jgi:hypothetical protein